MKPIRVFLIDDSAVVRTVLQAVLSAQSDINVIGTAVDPIFAWDRLQKDWPDVIVVDIELPRMDGLSFVRRLMAERPTPVIVCSSLTQEGSGKANEALAAGAFATVAKPRVALKENLLSDSRRVVDAIRAAARARRGANGAGERRTGEPPSAAAIASCRPSALGEGVARATGAIAAQPAWNIARSSPGVIAIGASTGGTVALESLLGALPATLPGLLIVQHMPANFTASFAHRLDQISELEVREARDGDIVSRGLALLAPGGRQMRVQRRGLQLVVEVFDGEPVNRHRPSVDVLFDSVARLVGAQAVGVLLTGMGDDGARGLKQMADTGAHTIAQDEPSCVVYGMPKEAVRLGAAKAVLPLEQIAPALARRVR